MEIKTNPIWSCKIGTRSEAILPPAADVPMRAAVQDAFIAVCGRHAEFTFSGWSATLDEKELAVVENRLPSEQHYREYVARENAVEIQAALKALLQAVCGETGFANAVRTATGTAYPWEPLDIAEARALAILTKTGGVF